MTNAAACEVHKLSREFDLYIIGTRRYSREVTIVATISFTRDFSITKRETVERLEKSLVTTKPLAIHSQNVVADIQRSEKKLLKLFHSKA